MTDHELLEMAAKAAGIADVGKQVMIAKAGASHLVIDSTKK